MKILVVANMYPDKKNPSAGTFVKNFCEQLSLIGIEHDISVMKKASSKLKKSFEYSWFYTKTFIKCMIGNYDLIYIHYPSFSSAPVLLAKKIRNFDIYVNVHGTDVLPLKKSHIKMHKFTEKSMQYAKKVIVPSLYFKKVVMEKYHINENMIFVYPSGGVNLKRFRCFDSTTLIDKKSSYDIPLNIPVIGFIGRMTRAKGWDVFLEAAKIVLNNGYDCKFLMVGSGEDDASVERMIREYGLENYILRYPMLSQEQLVEVYNLLDIFAFPTMSPSESLGLVAIEAMACGCVVIASDFAAPGDYVIDNYNGFKFPKGNFDALAKNIENYLNSDNDFRMLLKSGALETSKKYGIEASKELLNVIMKN